MWKARFASLPLAACAATMLVVTGPAETSAEEWPEMTITFSSALPEGGLNLGFEWWADELERRTDGAITSSRHYSASLMGALATLQGLADNRIDAGYMAAAYWPGTFPLWNVAGIPFQTDDPVAQVRAFYELYKENEAYRQEWDEAGIHLLLLQPLPHAALGIREPIEGADDLEGKRLRMVGYVAAALEALGVETVGLRPEELYEAIQRGVVDGFGAWPFDIIPMSALHEVAPHIYDIGYGHYASAAIGVSKEWWDGLDPAVQELMTEIAEEFMFEAALPLVEEMEAEACETILASGGTVEIFPDEEVETVRERVGDVSADRWLQGAVDQGVPVEAAESFRSAFLEKYAGYEGQMPYDSGMKACAER